MLSRSRQPAHIRPQHHPIKSKRVKVELKPHISRQKRRKTLPVYSASQFCDTYWGIWVNFKVYIQKKRIFCSLTTPFKILSFAVNEFCGYFREYWLVSIFQKKSSGMIVNNWWILFSVFFLHPCSMTYQNCFVLFIEAFLSGSRKKICTLTASSVLHVVHRWKIRAISTLTINSIVIFMRNWPPSIIHHLAQKDTCLCQLSRKYHFSLSYYILTFCHFPTIFWREFYNCATTTQSLVEKSLEIFYLIRKIF